MTIEKLVVDVLQRFADVLEKGALRVRYTCTQLEEGRIKLDQVANRVLDLLYDLNLAADHVRDSTKSAAIALDHRSILHNRINYLKEIHRIIDSPGSRVASKVGAKLLK